MAGDYSASIFVFPFFMMKSFINTVIWDFRDVKGDDAAGIKTLPIWLGEKKTRKLLQLMHTFHCISGSLLQCSTNILSQKYLYCLYLHLQVLLTPFTGQDRIAYMTAYQENDSQYPCQWGIHAGSGSERIFRFVTFFEFAIKMIEQFFAPFYCCFIRAY